MSMTQPKPMTIICGVEWEREPSILLARVIRFIVVTLSVSKSVLIKLKCVGERGDKKRLSPVRYNFLSLLVFYKNFSIYTVYELEKLLLPSEFFIIYDYLYVKVQLLTAKKVFNNFFSFTLLRIPFFFFLGTCNNFFNTL